MLKKQEVLTSSILVREKDIWIKELFNPQEHIPLLSLSSNDEVFYKTPNKSLKLVNKLVIYEKYIFFGGDCILLTNLSLRRLWHPKYEGIKLGTQTESIEFYSKKETIDQIFQYIRRQTIQSQFYNTYSIEKIVGKGAFGKVYKIKHRITGKIFATKQFTIKDLQSELVVNQLSILKEIEILRILEHPYILKFYEAYEDSKHIYLVFEYLSGGDFLGTLTKQQVNYDEKLVQNVIWKILTAINFVHQHNIFHRDLKLENIVLRRKNDYHDVAIVDFGLAEFYSETQNYLIPKCGTVGYAAPEIFTQNNYTTKIDIFPIGIIMYILLSGQHPFEGSDTEEIIYKTQECVVDYETLKYKGISHTGVDLLINLLEKNPSKRFTAEEALNHYWFTIPIPNQKLLLQLQNKYIQQFDKPKPLLTFSNLQQYENLNSDLIYIPNKYKKSNSYDDYVPSFVLEDSIEEEEVEDESEVECQISKQIKKYQLIAFPNSRKRQQSL